MKNTNAADVAAAARERREQARQEAQKKKEKDKEDRLIIIHTLNFLIDLPDYRYFLETLYIFVNLSQFSQFVFFYYFSSQFSRGNINKLCNLNVIIILTSEFPLEMFATYFLFKIIIYYLQRKTKATKRREKRKTQDTKR